MAVPSFLIKNGGEGFMNRQKNIFDVLSVVEKETCLSRAPSQEPTESGNAEGKRLKRKKTKRFRGKESMFKVPMDPPPKFLKPRPNPLRGKRWIKYSLADVTDYDLSNEGNAAAAFSFLKSLKDRKKLTTRKTENKGEDDGSNGKHLFKVSVTDRDKDEGLTKMNKAVFKSSKLVMPEYVVGQSKRVKKNVQRNQPNEKGQQVYLDHIHFHEDE